MFAEFATAAEYMNMQMIVISSIIQRTQEFAKESWLSNSITRDNIHMTLCWGIYEITDIKRIFIKSLNPPANFEMV